MSAFDTSARVVAVSQILISAYCRIWSLEEMQQALAIAIADRASGVQVTQINFQEGGGSGQPMSGDPNEIIEILELAIRQKEGGSAQPPPIASVINFNTRRSET